MDTGYVFINNAIMPTLLAKSYAEQEVGLMHREPPFPVMAFVYNAPFVNKFWMKNVKAPLDILFCHKGKISQICYGEPFSISVIGADSLSDLVVELPYGSVQEFGIKVGQDVGLFSV